VSKILEFAADNEMISEGFIVADADVAKLLYYEYVDILPATVFKKASLAAISNSDKDKIKFLLSNKLFTKEENYKLIGFNNFVGEWSRNIIDYIKNDSHIGVLPLDKADTEDKNFLSVFDGFVNPGAGDSFPKDQAFDLSYLNNGEIHQDHECAYQNVIDYAKEHSLPYLGLCNGAQHLILNNGGSIAKTTTNHNRVPHKLKVIPGSIIHFLAMNEQEQQLAISQGYFPEMEFSINTQHNYAGINGQIGDLELGGLSDEGVVEAVAHKFYQVAFQFHPENMYRTKEDQFFGRNANLLKNVFKFFALNTSSTDLDQVHAYTATELKEAYNDKAQCYIEETSACLAPQGLIRDLFSEAVLFSQTESN
jgi:gamma-glutamyl-gamma-aminobutyrate hydrolase PuuD